MRHHEFFRGMILMTIFDAFSTQPIQVTLLAGVIVHDVLSVFIAGRLFVVPCVLEALDATVATQFHLENTKER
jgi:hypothetical protein